MKTLVLGDTHGRVCWKNIIEQENPNRVIFLGDYFSSHDGITEEFQIQNYEEILEFKHTSSIEVVMLRGNHDMEACGYSWARCYPVFDNSFLHKVENRKEFLDNTQWVFVDGDIIFSHAGISENWYQCLHIDSVEEINTLEPSKLFGFTPGPDNPFDSYGHSIYQPCTWIRPATLADCAIPGTHVVGHSRIFEEVECLANHLKDQYKNSNIWLCDTLPQSYLIIEDNEFKPKNYVQ